MTGDPVAKGFSLATLAVTAAAALALMAALAYEIRPLAELDGLTITALLFGFFNALGSLLWREERSRRSEEPTDLPLERHGFEAWPGDRRLALAQVGPRRQSPPAPLPFPDRRSPRRQDRRRLLGGGRRSTDLPLPGPAHAATASAAEPFRLDEATVAGRRSLER